LREQNKRIVVPLPRMRTTITTISLVLSFALSAFAQNGVIKGKVFNPINNDPIPFANVVIQGTTLGASTDLDGNYEITGLEPKLYNLEASSLGFSKSTVYEIQTFNNRPVYVNIEMSEDAQLLDAVEIVASPFSKKAVTSVG